MPELPEVETISQDLNKKIPGLIVRDFWTDLPAIALREGGLAIRNITYPSTLEKFKKEIIGREVLKVYRKGKNILIDLTGGKLLLIHQKMTGHLLIGKWNIKEAKSEKPARMALRPDNSVGRVSGWRKAKNKEEVVPISGGFLAEKVNGYIHAIFYLSDGRQLALSDLRKFAKIMAGDKDKIENLPDLQKLGPDPLDASFKFIKFLKLIKLKKGKIKQVLMDQSVISGIGNIYSDEILWFAKIHPFTRVEKLGEKDLRNIYKYTKDVLKEAIKLRGISISDYRDPEGKAGGYDKIRRVYRREGEKCPRCGADIKRLKMGGRSAHYCPKCQKL